MANFAINRTPVISNVKPQTTVIFDIWRIAMPNTIGQFSFEITKMDKDSRMPFNPYICLCLKHWGDTTRDGAPIISANLMTDQEIDFHIDQLKADLDKLAGRAKGALKKVRENARISESPWQAIACSLTRRSSS